MKNNPFLSSTYTTIWSKHFNGGELGIYFSSITSLSFVKHRFIPLFINTGKTQTKGINYSLIFPLSKKTKQKAFLIYDIPQYCELNNSKLPKGVKLKKIEQHKGFLMDLSNYKTLDQYVQENFSSSRKNKLQQYKKKLHSCFNIDYKMFYGDTISKEKYESLFKNFKLLLEKRFQEKKTKNSVLSNREWGFLKEVSFPMIKNKEACLFVIYESGEPIAIALNFLGENILFGAITVFDIDYKRFSLGYINILKTAEWCIQKNIDFFDFSKGNFDYKKVWSNKKYCFENHILYDSNYLPTRLIGVGLVLYFKIKQKLRDKNINDYLHKIQFSLFKKNKLKKNDIKFNVEILSKMPPYKSVEKIDNYSSSNNNLKQELLSFLSKYKEGISNVEIYREKKTASFIFKGQRKIQKVTPLNILQG